MIAAFWLKNLSFAIELSSAITLFLCAFLLYDTWTVKKEVKTGLQGAGYIILALYFLLTASQVSFTFSTYLIVLIKVLGLALLVSGLFIDRLNPVPKLAAGFFLVPLSLISPLLFGIVTVLYFLKATKGYEKNLIWVACGFFFLALSDLIFSFSFLKTSDYLAARSFYEAFGAGFYLQNIFLLVAVALLFIWSLGYLRFRLLSQMFLYFTLGSLGIFLLSTFIFTSFLLSNIQNSVRDNLILSGKNFQYSLNQLEDKALITARGIATNDSIKDELKSSQRVSIYKQMTQFFFPSKGDNLLVTDSKGVVVANSADRDAFGSSVSGKEVVQRAISGFEGVRLTTSNKNALPNVIIEAASPIKDGKTVVGVAVATYSIDNFFVDDVKAVTGLDVTVYSGQVKAATTFQSPDKKERLVGASESNQEVVQKVLGEGKTQSETKQIFGQDYSAVYLPLENVDKKPVGMVFVGRPAKEILEAVNSSVNLTFLVIVLLTLASIIPSYLIAAYIDRNQKA